MTNDSDNNNNSDSNNENDISPEKYANLELIGPAKKRLASQEKFATDVFELYFEYGKTLRTWLVSYGIGAPFIVLTTTDVFERVSASGNGKWIIYPFLIATSAQILVAFVNKWTNWLKYFYSGTRKKTYLNRLTYSWFGSAAMHFCADAISIIMFTIGTVFTVNVFV